MAKSNKSNRTKTTRRAPAPPRDTAAALFEGAWQPMTVSETIAFRQRWQRAYSDRVAAANKHRSCACRVDHPVPHPEDDPYSEEPGVYVGGYDWHAFSSGPMSIGDADLIECLSATRTRPADEVVFFRENCSLPGAIITLVSLVRAIRAANRRTLEDCYFTPRDLHWTYVRTHENLGPWFVTPDTDLRFESAWGLPESDSSLVRSPRLVWRDPRAFSARGLFSSWKPPSETLFKPVLGAAMIQRKDKVIETALREDDWRNKLFAANATDASSCAELAERLVARELLPASALDSDRRFARGMIDPNAPPTRDDLVALDETLAPLPRTARDLLALTCAWSELVTVERLLRDHGGAQRFEWRVARGVAAIDVRDTVDSALRERVASLGMLALDVRDGVARVVCPPL